MQTNMKNMTDSGLIQEQQQKKKLPDGASASPANSTAETSAGTHGLHMHRLHTHRLFFSSLQMTNRNSMVK